MKLERRDHGPDGLYLKSCNDDQIPEPVRILQAEVHKPGIYDMEDNTYKMSPYDCSRRLRDRIESSQPSNAFWLNADIPLKCFSDLA